MLYRTRTPANPIDHRPSMAPAGASDQRSVAPAGPDFAGYDCSSDKLAGAHAAPSLPRTPAELDSADDCSQVILSAAGPREPAGATGEGPLALPAGPARPFELAFAGPIALQLRLAMCIRICPDCSTLFGVALTVYARKLEEGRMICCPNGHAVAVGGGEVDGEGKAALDADGLRHLAENLADASHRLACQEDELRMLRARLESAGLPTNREVRRRCNVLSNRAEPAKYGELVCPACGKAKRSAAALSNHLYRQHHEPVWSMPASQFE
jgi:hypothetical protein